MLEKDWPRGSQQAQHAYQEQICRDASLVLCSCVWDVDALELEVGRQRLDSPFVQQFGKDTWQSEIGTC